MGFQYSNRQSYRAQATRHSLYQQAKERVSDYCFCYSWLPKHSNQRAGKIDKYQDLRTELQKVWNAKVVVIHVVICALATKLKKIHHYTKQTNILTDIVSIQKIAILGTAYILQRVLGI